MKSGKQLGRDMGARWLHDNVRPLVQGIHVPPCDRQEIRPRKHIEDERAEAYHGNARGSAFSERLLKVKK